MTEYLHQQDGTRPVTCGVNIFFNLLSSLGFGVYSDEKAKKEVSKPKKKAVGSQFFNDMAGLLGGGFMKMGATLHGCDVKTRGAFAQMDMAGYNYGINRYAHDLKKYPQRLILGSETFCSDAYAFWQQAQEEPRLVGDFVWAGMDYLGEVGVGSWEYPEYAPSFDHGPGWITAGSGRIDLIGNPLAEAEYTKVAFGLTTGPVIAVRPVHHSGEKHSPSAWKMTDAICSWNWQGCEGRNAYIEVYSTAPSVELQLNGTSVGKKTRGKNCLFTFQIPYQPGILTAIAYDDSGAEQTRSQLTTGSAVTVLSLQPEADTVAPGHLAFINLRYTDTAGNLKPQEHRRVQVQVEGGKLLALGNACPFNADPHLYQGTDTFTYYGQALAIVEADGSGDVKLTATDGTLSGEVVVPLSCS
jgi:beta-galactosidase